MQTSVLSIKSHMMKYVPGVILLQNEYRVACSNTGSNSIRIMDFTRINTKMLKNDSTCFI